MEPQLPQTNNKIELDNQRVKDKILDEKEDCDKAYNDLVVKNIQSPALTFKEFSHFAGQLIQLYIVLQPHIPEKKIYRNLKDLDEYARAPYMLAIKRVKKQDSEVFKEFVEYYFTLLKFMYEIGITKVATAKSRSIELLGEV